MYIRYSQSPSTAASLPQRLAAAVLRTVFVVGGMLLMLGALMLGLVLATGVLLWALLRGRRPGPVNLRWRTMARPGGFGAWTGPSTRSEVVDVDARVVAETDRPPPR